MAVVINGNGNITGLDGVFSADSVNTLVDTRIDSDSFVELTGNQTVAGIKTFSDSANFTGGHLRVYNSTDSEEQILIAEVSGGYSNGAGVSLRRDGVEMGRVNADYFDGMTFHVTDGANGAATQKARLSTAGSFVIGENETPYNLFSVRDSDMGFEVNPNESQEVRLNAYDRGQSVFRTMALQADPVVIRPGGANGVGYTTIDNDGIKFNSDTAAANGLDDYEQGTWTPNLNYGGGSAGQVMASAHGTYTKIGRVVHCNLIVNQTTKGTSTGLVDITLPFTVADLLNGTVLEASGSIGYISGVNANPTSMGATASQGAGIRLYHTNASNQLSTQTNAGDIDNAFQCRISISYQTS